MKRVVSHANLPSFKPADLIEELHHWPLTLEYLADSHTYQFLLNGIRESALCMIIDVDIYPGSACLKDFEDYHQTMEFFIQKKQVPPHVIRNYARLIEIFTRAFLCYENPDVQRREYLARIKTIPYLD